MIENIHEKTNGTAFKIIFALVSLSFVLGGIGGGLIGKNTSAIKVNGQEISQQAFNNAKGQEQSRRNAAEGATFWENLDNPEYADAFNQSVINQLVDDELLRQFAKNLKLDISVDQIKQQIVSEQAFQNNGKFDNQLYLNALHRSGLTSDGYASLVREGLLFSQIQEGIMNTEFETPAQQELIAKLLIQKRQVRLATFPIADEMAKQTVSTDEIQAYYDANKSHLIEPEKLTAEYVLFTPQDVAKNIQVTDDQIKTYYDTNKAQFATQAEDKVAHIQVATEAEAQSIEQALKNGADFAKLAEEKSTDKISAKQGGDLGWAKSGTFPKAFEQAVSTLQVGQISTPIKVDDAYHIIKLLDRKTSQEVPLEQVKNQIIDAIKSELMLTEYSNISHEMANKALESSGSLTEVAKLGGVDIQKTTQFTQKTIPDALKNDRVEKLLFSSDLKQSGQNSEALDIGDDQHPATLFVRVSDYQAERTQTLEEAKPLIETQIKREKAEKVLSARADESLKAINEGKADSIHFGNAQEFVYAKASVEAPLLAETIFKMPRPTDKPVYQIAHNQQGDVMVVALDKIVDGNLEEFKPALAQLHQANQLMLRNNLLSDLRERASIEVNDDFMEQNMPSTQNP